MSEFEEILQNAVEEITKQSSLNSNLNLSLVLFLSSAATWGQYLCSRLTGYNLIYGYPFFRYKPRMKYKVINLFTRSSKDFLEYCLTRPLSTCAFLVPSTLVLYRWPVFRKSGRDELYSDITILALAQLGYKIIHDPDHASSSTNFDKQLEKVPQVSFL
jgi:hypothetical protein